MDADRSWFHRVLVALPPPSERARVLLFFGMVVLGGVMMSLILASSREVDRHAREVERLVSSLPSRPTLQQQVDALAQRVQALEHRQTP